MLATLDIVIGIVFFFALFSLLCTALNELIEVWLKARRKFLWQGICTLLNDKAGTGLVKAVYDHPLVNGLFRNPYAQNAPDLPSYIPSRNFALALLNIAFKDKAATFLRGATAGSAPPQGAPPAVAPAPPVQAPGLPALTDQERAAARKVIEDLATPPTGATGSDYQHVSKALLTLGDAAGWDPVKLRENVEQWFDSAMDRVSGWYKRHAQQLILVVALCAAVAFNADSLNIAKTLSNDPALRQALVARAEQAIKDQPAPGARTPVNPNAPATPAGPSGATGVGGGASEAATKPGATPPTVKTPELTPEERLYKEKQEAFDKALKDVRALGLPLDWQCRPKEAVDPAKGGYSLARALGLCPELSDEKAPDGGTSKTGSASVAEDPRWEPDTRMQWFFKLLGLFCTALAASLGAPFWFDMLNKIMVVRATVKPTEKSPAEPAVDR